MLLINLVVAVIYLRLLGQKKKSGRKTAPDKATKEETA